MSINNSALTQANRGTLFIAPENEPLPSNLGDFVLGSPKVGNWENLGHTSNNTKPAFAVSGGQASNLDTWLQANTSTTYSDTTGTLTVESVQGDAETLKTIYNGADFKNGVAFGLEKQAQRKALFLIWQDGRGARMGVYMPSTDLTYNSLPNMGNNDYVSFGLQASILTSTILPAGPSGKPTCMVIFSPDQFGASTPVTGVTVIPPTASVAVGASKTLTAAVEPSDANQSVRWSSSDPAIATVDDTGKVTGVAAGTATVTASSITDLSKNESATITVTASA